MRSAVRAAGDGGHRRGGIVDDADILTKIRALVDEEHDLRTRSEAGAIDPDDEQRRLTSLEESLDQCWDLLRQRRARRDAGQNPDAAHSRDVREVEGYLQ
jgi:hypothetical protein